MFDVVEKIENEARIENMNIERRNRGEIFLVLKTCQNFQCHQREKENSTSSDNKNNNTDNNNDDNNNTTKMKHKNADITSVIFCVCSGKYGKFPHEQRRIKIDK